MLHFLKRPEKTGQAVRKTRETWFGRVRGLLRRGSLDTSTWEELEEMLIAADVGVATTSRLVAAVRTHVEHGGGPDAGEEALRRELLRIVAVPPAGAYFGSEAPPRPAVILVVGVNGVGKTTSIAKLTKLLVDQGERVVLAAADTFRAAAIDQLREWGERTGATVVAHQPNADPGAVVHDALAAGRARGASVIIVDTAGRLHTKSNLMEELKKIRRVIERSDPTAPHEVLLVIDATTGQNGLVQARSFGETTGLTGLILAKLDSTAKGGIVLAVCDQLRVPVTFVGTGEGIDDLAPFDPEEFADALLPRGEERASPAAWA